MERVLGIGGVFFRSERPDELRAWYARHLGVELEPSGAAVFRAEAGDVTVWHAFPGRAGCSSSGSRRRGVTPSAERL